jgi:hypothetical protein
MFIHEEQLDMMRNDALKVLQTKYGVQYAYLWLLFGGLRWIRFYNSPDYIM